MGSLAFAAAARAAWAVSKDKDDPRRRLLLPIKNNLAPDTGGLAYRIEPLGVDGCPVVAWEPDPVNVSADDALAGDRDDGGGRTERDDAAEWLADLLAHGPRPAREVERDAREAGYSIATVRRAKAALGVVSRKPAFGGPWEWTLAAQDAQPPKMLTEDAHTPASEHLGEKQAENDGNPPKMLNDERVSALGEGERLGDAEPDAGDGWGELGGPAQDRQPDAEDRHTPDVGDLRVKPVESFENRPKIATPEGLAILGASGGNLGDAGDGWGEL
jgi:hypothetical protein